MTQKEITDIGISLSILMDYIVDMNCSAEDTANISIDFAKDILDRYPKLREVVDSIFSDSGKYIQWIEWEKRMLPHN